MMTTDLETKMDEREQALKDIYGLGIIVVDPYTGNIAGFRDKKGKKESGREPGDVSIICETRKEKERPKNTLKGGLVEITGDQDRDTHDITRLNAGHFVHMSGNTFYPIDLKIGERTVPCGIAVVIFDYQGGDHKWHPLNAAEVEDVRWRSPQEFLDPHVNVRRAARDIVGAAVRSGIVDNNIVNYHEHPERRLPVLSPDFSLGRMYEKREQAPDVKWLVSSI